MISLETESWVWYGIVIILGPPQLHLSCRNQVNTLRSPSPIPVQVASFGLYQELSGGGLLDGLRRCKRSPKYI
jgi:hypothetical protein